MFSKAPPSILGKRPNEESSIERPKKSPFGDVKVESDAPLASKNFWFHVLLPNGTTLELKMTERRSQMPIEEFIDAVKREYFSTEKRTGSSQKTGINWTYADLHFTDADGNKIRTEVKFRDLLPNKRHILVLNDGSAEPEAYEDMWDLTPDTELLKELPDEYTFETALADLIDNSLQAVWSNRKVEKRLISVELRRNRISIFDTGPGMDGVNEKIVKWGKMGASMHRAEREQAIGGKPPYLMPFFGMFGYGGPVATMFLGRHAVVSSKTKTCNKVFTLHLEREALISPSRTENQWKTKGGMRDPLDDEMVKSRHGSFTKVDILEPKTSNVDVKKLQCKLKDIYFPYIQCDEMSGKTSTPIDFQVNGINLTEIEGGEVAITNMNSCNGPEFTLLLHFSYSDDASSQTCQRQKSFLDANARLRCVYFPVIKGEESITRIIDKLDADGFEIRETFDNYSRVSVRRLGRLLPDARWTWLPFMEPKAKKGEKAQNLKRCRYRVKCFIETDSGFNPTPSKTDLAHHHPYTNALKNFGSGTPVNGKEVQIEIWRDGKKLTLTTLEKQYSDWISEMHDLYDDEIESGLDQPTILISPKSKKLGLSSDVVRVHKEIKRKGTCWKAGQRMKILKGACAGCHKNNVFATLEYIILEGLLGDACGEARLICRPLGLPEGKGCSLPNNGNDVLDICESLSLPISVIDSEKCVAVGDIEWESQLDKHRQKLPSSIDLLSFEECQELEIGGGFPTDVIEAGDAFPQKIVAVVRPKAFTSASSPKRLDQKFIVRENYEMILEVNFRVSKKSTKSDHICSVRIKPSSHKGLQGLYIFLLSSKIEKFQKAGLYTFYFSLADLKDVRFRQVVQVQALAEIGSWRLVNHSQNPQCTIRVGCRTSGFSIACYDRYDNRIPFTGTPRPTIKLIKGGHVLAQVRHMKVTADKSIMIIKDIVVECRDLDKIRPKYEAHLKISSEDKALSVDCPCQVLPGPPKKITTHPPKLRKQLLPGQIIEKLMLEVFDEYGNHVKKDENILLRVDGFSFQDGSCVVRSVVTDCNKMVDARGYVDLSDFLKVSKGYGKDVSLSVISKDKVIFKMEFQTERRELRTESKIFKYREAGSELENIMFEIVNSDGVVDENINDNEKHGQIHTLTLKSDSMDMDDFVRYSFSRGRCTVRSINLPQRKGTFTFTASHSRYPDLKVDIEVHVQNDRGENLEVGNHEDFGDPEFFPKTSFRKVMTPLRTPTLDVPDVEPVNVSPHGLKEIILHSDYSSLKNSKLEDQKAQTENSDPMTLPVHGLASQDRGDFTGHSLLCLKELEDDLANCGLTIGKHDSDLNMLRQRQSTLQRHISDLKALVVEVDAMSTFGKDYIEQKIESRGDSASAFVCKFRKLALEERPKGILGVVALLGSVQTIELSRMLAQYLGEDQMLAIVCENYAAAESFDTRFSSKSSSGRYLTLCLEDTRTNGNQLESDSQNLDSLQEPTLPNGCTPHGFLGYAVRLVNTEAVHSQGITKSDLSIRQTLLCCLFGGLQVYENKQCMKMARACIRDGAISLDGGIIKRNGLISFGSWEQVTPDVIFPVVNKMPVPSASFKALKCMVERESELAEVNRAIHDKNTLYKIDMEIFQRSRNRYNLYLTRMQSAPQNSCIDILE
ncbi:structural maintenance of chromosomes flexible hinge domain-containing protein GMI1-like [Henckelia pumila]|uniref:structural maintenance of chromosomes flexible hinge domain-containing protein GMI1-like n=1 Tax=Henckelia pumila TaxID=405737 RepID=UPI003C6E36F6